MKKAGIAVFFVVVAAMAYALLQPTRVYLMRQKLFGRGLAWSSRNCEVDKDCEAVVYRGNGAACEYETGWITSRRNPALSRLRSVAQEIKDIEIGLGENVARKSACEYSGALKARCNDAVCMALPR